MITAKTLQLLDANNYNISPAVCVDSLYFERTQSGNTYRMSLRNRWLVAGDSILLNTPINEFKSLSNVVIPYVYFRNVDGTDTTNGRIIQVESGAVNLGPAFENALKEDMKAYADKDFVDKNYLSKNNSNYAEQRIRVRASGAIDLYASDDTHASVNLCAGRLYMGAGDNLGKISASGKLEISATDQLSLVHTASDTNVSLDTHGFVVDSANISIKSTNNTEISGNAVSLKGNSVIVENLTGNTALELNQNQIKLKADSVVLYDAPVQKPTASAVATSDTTNAFLRVKMKNSASGKMPELYEWTSTPVLDILDTQNDTTNLLNIQALRTDTTQLYMASLFGSAADNDAADFQRFRIVAPQQNGANNNRNNSATDAYFRALRSGDVTKRTLVPYGNTIRTTKEFIDIKTINGESLLGDTNIELLTNADISDLLRVKYTGEVENTNQQYKIFGGSLSQINSLNTPRSGSVNDKDKEEDATVQYIDGVYFKGNGNMYASQYFSNSDERLKTEIKDIDKNAPAINVRQFNWKDTSAHSFGFIAQEVEVDYPELIEIDAETGYKKVDYNAALALKVAQLENEIKSLKETIEFLKIK